MVLLRPRVFISSVMRDYEAFRDAAARGIEAARCLPVRAEDFPSLATSPRTACLDGVKSADALVLLLGQRYGWVAPSGISATEEEYEEAIRDGKPVLVFVQDVPERETQQEALVRKVSDYVKGRFRVTYHGPEDLEEKVEEALRVLDLGSSGREELAGMRIQEELGAVEPRAFPQGVAWIRVAWSTIRDESVWDPAKWDGIEEDLLSVAHRQEIGLLSHDFGKRRQRTADLLQIVQPRERDGWRSHENVVIRLKPSGLLSVSQNVQSTLPGDDPSSYLQDEVCIRPAVVRERLMRAWRFAAAWWAETDSFRRHDPLLYNVALYEVGCSPFGEPNSSGGVTLRMPPITDPVVVYDSPRRISRTALESDAQEETERALKLLELCMEALTNEG